MPFILKDNTLAVCILLYKPEPKYLLSLSESLRIQTVSNFHIYISDNGNSEDLVNEIFCGMNFIYLKCWKLGIFENLNFVISYINSEFIQIICQDDYASPELLENQLKAFEIFPECGMVYTQVDIIDSENSVLKKNFDFGYNYISKDILLNYYLEYGCLPGNLSVVMLKKSVVDKIGFFNTDLPFAADFEYWIRMSGYFDLAINYSSDIKLRKHDKQASVTFSNNLYLNDMNYICNIFYKKINSPWYKKIYILNSIYGINLFKRVVSQSIKNKKINNLFFYLLKFRFPLNFIFTIILFTLNKANPPSKKLRFPVSLHKNSLTNTYQ
jgi:glycosyltransferase involved in cell wall biosynthesis